MDDKQLIGKANSNRIGGLVSALRGPQEESPPTGPATGTVSPEVSKLIQDYKAR